MLRDDKLQQEALRSDGRHQKAEPTLDLGELSAFQPNRKHDNDKSEELEQYAPTHQFLRQIRTTAPHHVEEPKAQNKYNRQKRDRHQIINKTFQNRAPAPVQISRTSPEPYTING